MPLFTISALLAKQQNGKTSLCEWILLFCGNPLKNPLKTSKTFPSQNPNTEKPKTLQGPMP